MTRRVVVTGLLAGLLMNIFGWLGNQLWLGSEWDAAVAGSAFAAARSRTIWNELGSLLPDFVYGLAFAALCGLAARTLGPRRRVAYGMAVVLWAVAIATPLLGTANAAFVPWRVTLLTILLALIVMLPIAEFVHRRLVSGVPDSRSDGAA
jgi:hypothetical protein